jgi:hypothetical protein
MKITVTRGFGAFGKRSRKKGRKGSKTKMGRAAKHCKGKPGAAFRACVKTYFRTH